MREPKLVRKGGRWVARAYLGRDANGSQIRPSKTFPGDMTESEARAAALEWAESLAANGHASARLVDILAEYVDDLEAKGRAPRTIVQYRWMLDILAPLLKGMLARDLEVGRASAIERALLERPSKRGKPLSRRSVLTVHRFLSAAYKQMVREGTVASNPFDWVEPPRPNRLEAEFLTEADMPVLSEAVEREMEGEGFDAAVAYAAYLSLHEGVRLGEALALRERDVFPRQGYLHVCGTVDDTTSPPVRKDVTKGRRSRNVATAPEVMETVRSRLTGKPTRPLVTVDGSVMRPTCVGRAFKRLARRLDLPPRFTFHDLRHTHAAWCLMHGVDVKTLSERLGHADEATTLRIYAHVLPGRDMAAAEAFERAVDPVWG